MKKFKSITIKIISSVLCIALCISVFIGVILVSIKVGIVSHDAIKNSIISSGYGDILAQDVKEKIYQYGDMTGINHEVFDTSIEYNSISTDLYESVESLLNGREYKLDTTTMKQNLVQNIKNDISARSANADDKNLNENIEKLASACVDVYEDSVTMPLLKSLSREIGTRNKFLVPLISVCFVTAAVLISIILLIQKWKHRGIRYILYSLMGVEWMLIITVFAIHFSNVIKRISVSSKGFYNFLTLLLNNFVFNLYIWIAVIAVATGLTAMLYVKSKKKIRQRNSKNQIFF